MADIRDMPPNIPCVLPEISEEELEKFAKINFRAGREGIDSQVDPIAFQELIEEGGLSAARYREIYVALEREPHLRVAMQQLMSELHEEE